MRDTRQETQAGLYAIGALPADEAFEFERALRSSLELQLLVNAYRESANAMAMAIPTTPAPLGLKTRLLASLPRSPHAVGAAWAPWALAVGFAVVCLLLLITTRNFHRQATAATADLQAARDQIARLEKERDEAAGLLESTQAGAVEELRKLRNEAVERSEYFGKQRRALEDQLAQRNQEHANAISRLQHELGEAKDELAKWHLTGGLSNARDRFGQIRAKVLLPSEESSSRRLAALVWDVVEQRGIVIGENFSALGPDRDYQLWLLDARFPSPLNAGVLTGTERGQMRAEFRVSERLESIERCGITIERKGGAPSPQGSFVLLSR